MDEAAFARFWVESRDTHRPKGKRALAWELLQKGVADATIEDALARFGGDEAALAEKVARKRAATLKTADPFTFRRQLGAFLARRGFGYEIAEQVVNEIWEERRAGLEQAGFAEAGDAKADGAPYGDDDALHRV